jgi:hypothetical protein
MLRGGQPPDHDAGHAELEERLAHLRQALVTIAGQEPPPRRFIAGTDAIALAEQKVADLKAEIDAHRDLSTSLALDLEPAVRARQIAMRATTMYGAGDIPLAV